MSAESIEEHQRKREALRKARNWRITHPVEAAQMNREKWKKEHRIR